jgi:hypothetical protein
MATLVGGVIALILGVLGLVYWWNPFIVVLQAAIPLVLILGGALAAYLGIEEWKDSQAMQNQQSGGGAEAETARYKAEAERYKKELEDLKKQQEPEEQPSE